MKTKKTISDALFKFWQKNRRHGDNIKLMELTGKTDPTIRKYLSTGNVPDTEVVEKITNFFKERIEKEKELLKS